VLRIALVEDPINYNSPPGSNGERDFESVVRKLIPTAAGTPLGLGDTPTQLDFSYTIPASFNRDRLYVVVFVQGVSSKIVYKGAKIKIGSAIASSVNEAADLNAVSTVYPNPATDLTQLDYELTNSADVHIELKNITGQTVFTSDKGRQSPGQYKEAIDLSGFGSGIYLLQLRVGDQLLSHRIVKQ
jgi:hypothetical protein